MFRILTVIMVGLLVVISTNANALDIKVHPEDPTKILLVGTVETGDVEKFTAHLETNTVTLVAFYSGGGMVSVGVELAELIAANNLDTIILKEMKCYSICSLMWAAGNKRTVEPGGELGVHQVYADPKYIANTSSVEYSTNNMRTIAYMIFSIEKMDRAIDNMFWVHLLNTPWDEMYVFTEEEITYLER